MQIDIWQAYPQNTQPGSEGGWHASIRDGARTLASSVYGKKTRELAEADGARLLAREMRLASPETAPMGAYERMMSEARPGEKACEIVIEDLS